MNVNINSLELLIGILLNLKRIYIKKDILDHAQKEKILEEIDALILFEIKKTEREYRLLARETRNSKKNFKELTELIGLS